VLQLSMAFDGSQESGGETVDAAGSAGQFEELMNLTPTIFLAYRTSLPLPDHVHSFVTLNGSPVPPGIL
jgi:hypothetical protein